VRQVHRAAHPESDARGHPGARVEGEVLLDGEDIYARTVDPVEVRRTIAWCSSGRTRSPRCHPDNVVAGHETAGHEEQGPAGPDHASAHCARPTWNEVKDRLTKPAAGCPAGNSSGCASPGHRRAADVLLMDEPCSALDPISTLAHRGPDRRAEEGLHDRHRHAQHATGRPGQRQTAFFNCAPPGSPAGWWRSTTPTRSSPTPRSAATEDYISGRFG